jgi:lysozyme family protein
MKSSYDESMRRLLRHEGGYSNHPSDPGGPTNHGITIADYRRHVKPHATAADVRAMTVAEARAIYRAHYWDAQRCDELPAGVDYAVFDYGVNSGVGRSGKVLRRLLGLSDRTHRIDDETIRSAGRRDAAELVAAICDERLAFLKRLKTWPAFGAGWGRRVAEVRAHALAMARPRPTSPVAGAAAGGAVVAGGAAAQQMHMAGVHPAAVAAAMLIAIALAVAILWWRSRKRRQEVRI